MPIETLLREPALLRVLGQVAAASAIVSFGGMALFFFSRTPRKLWLLSYALLAIGIAIYLLLPFFAAAASKQSAEIILRTSSALSFLLPATGYLLLLSFSDLRVTLGRGFLLALPVTGAVLALATDEASRARLGRASGIILLVLSLEFLLALWRQGRRRKREAPLLFTGTSILVLVVLTEAAIRNGVLLVSREALPLLGPGFLCFTLLFLIAIAEEGERLLTRATTDLLTGLSNRMAFLERARSELERAGRSGGSLAAAIIDVDHFKQVNDRFGHREGDRVLVAVSKAIQETIRGLDIAARWGGEEFVILYVAVEEKGALIAIERLRRAISALEPPRVPKRITVSAGITLHYGQFDRASIEELVHRADLGLYDSKRNGRDRTTLVQTDPEKPSDASEVRYR